MTLTDEQKKQCKEAFHNTREMPLGSMLRNSKPHPEFVAGYVAGLSAQPESKPAISEERVIELAFIAQVLINPIYGAPSKEKILKFAALIAAEVKGEGK